MLRGFPIKPPNIDRYLGQLNHSNLDSDRHDLSMFVSAAKGPPSILDVVLTHRGVHVTAVFNQKTAVFHVFFSGGDLHGKQNRT